MTELKYSIESFNSRLDHSGKDPVNSKIGDLKLFNYRDKKKKEWKRVKKAYRTDRIPSKELVYVL